MNSPFIRAKAKDNADALDNALAYLDPANRRDVADYVSETLRDIEGVLVQAAQDGDDPLVAYRTFVSKLHEYYKGSELNLGDMTHTL